MPCPEVGGGGARVARRASGPHATPRLQAQLELLPALLAEFGILEPPPRLRHALPRLVRGDGRELVSAILRPPRLHIWAIAGLRAHLTVHRLGVRDRSLRVYAVIRHL